MILHEVITTEKVPFTYRVAGMGARFLAWLIDASLMSLIGFAGIAVGACVLERMLSGLGGAVLVLWIFALSVLYFLVFEWLWAGQTPGKRALGIRVIQFRGTSISFFQAAARNLVRMVDALPFFYGLGFVIAACNEKHLRLGDWAAGTLVVHVERKPRLVRALQGAAEEALPLSLPLVRQRLGQLTRPQKQVLLDLCLRRDQLRITDRAQLFRAVAEYIKEQLDLHPAALQSDEKFVVQLASVLSAGGT